MGLWETNQKVAELEKKIKIMAETVIEQQAQGQICPPTMKKLQDISKGKII